MSTRRGEELPFVPARYFDMLVAMVTNSREQRLELLREAGLSADRLASPDCLLRLAEVERLLPLCQQQARNPALALDLGQELNLSAHGTLGFAGLSSATLEEAVRVAQEFFPLITPLLDIDYRRTSQGGQLRVLPAQPLSANLQRFLTETLLASLYTQGHYLLAGRIPPARVLLPFEDGLALYRTRFPELMLSASPDGECLVTLPGPVMDTPLPLANTSARAQARAQCQRQLERLPHPDDLVRTVRGLLFQHSDCWTAGAMAQRLGLSERSLRRHLAGEGVNFRDLLGDARMERARVLLEERGLAISAVATRVGYTEVANFSRAWRRHFGYPPGRHHTASGGAGASLG